MGINYLRTGPILTTPGGWGLRNPEPKGPGQRRIVFSQSSTAVAGRKLGGIMLLANDPVTAFFSTSTGPNTIRRTNLGSVATGPLAAAAGRRDHIALGMIPKSGIRFSEHDHACDDRRCSMSSMSEEPDPSE